MDTQKTSSAPAANPAPTTSLAASPAPGAYAMLNSPSGSVTSQPFRAMKQQFQKQYNDYSSPLAPMPNPGMAAPNDRQRLGY